MTVNIEIGGKLVVNTSSGTCIGTITNIVRHRLRMDANLTIDWLNLSTDEFWTLSSYTMQDVTAFVESKQWAYATTEKEILVAKIALKEV